MPEGLQPIGHYHQVLAAGDNIINLDALGVRGIVFAHAPTATASIIWMNLNGKPSGLTPPATPTSDFIDCSSSVGGGLYSGVIPMIGNKINFYAVGAGANVAVDFIAYR